MPGTALSREDREEIYAGVRAGESFTDIAKSIGRPTSTVSREVASNGGRRRYKASTAEARAERKRKRPKVPKLVADPELRAEITKRLKDHRLSPCAIAHQLADEGVGGISHETIYQSVFAQGTRGLPAGLHRSLHRRRRCRKHRHRDEVQTTRSSPLGTFSTIHERPAIAARRVEVGHWEGDLILGTSNRSAVVTLIDRASYLCLANSTGRCNGRYGLLGRACTLPILMTVAVKAQQLRKTYSGRGGNVEAVQGVDLEVAAGEIFGFLGPNGAGKSTTVRMLTTLMTITSGEAYVAGVNVAAHPDAARRKIGVALQEAGLDSRQTGRELLVLQAQLFGVSRGDAQKRAQVLLELVELVESADRRIKGYSGGMKRRLDLASALVHEPDVLFLDEPTTGLDPASRITVWDEVRRINEQGTTVFLTTQYLEEADQLCDRLAIIDGGLIVREGTPEALKSELRQRMGLDQDPSLDDVFLDATGRSRVRGVGEVQEVRA